MITPIVSDVIGIINKIAPLRFAEEWDNPGLQVGDPAAQASRIMVALDPCLSSVEHAIEHGCTLLLTHHPLIFKPLKRVSRQDPDGIVICRALESGISIVSLHTNYDVAAGGVNDLLADRLGLLNCSPLQITSADELLKLVVFVPDGYEQAVFSAISRFSFRIGNYSDCSFSAPGTGTFKALEGAAPFIGSPGELSSVPESRLEILILRDNAAAAVSAMKKVHPYEEPAFDLCELSNRGESHGLGRIGELGQEVTLLEFAEFVKARLNIPHLRIVGENGKMIKRVAICGGSGISLLRNARFRGADLLLTGDVKYHDAREAESHGIAIMDAGHFATENLMIAGLIETLLRELPARGFKADLLSYDGERDPFRFV